MRFSAERNRTELILDFPDKCDPDNISSLAPHPSSALVASRSTNHDEQSEALILPFPFPFRFSSLTRGALQWTCVHDLRVPRAGAGDEEEAAGSSRGSRLILTPHSA